MNAVETAFKPIRKSHALLAFCGEDHRRITPGANLPAIPA